MKITGTISDRQESIEHCASFVRDAAKYHGYPIQDAFSDWVMEHPQPAWLVDGVAVLLDTKRA